MIALIQRVRQASVTVKNKIVASIKHGIVIFLGVTLDDTELDCKHLSSKIQDFRIFENEKGKMDISCRQAKAEILVVSEFTLVANTQVGRRPSFSKAANKEKAEKLYNYFIKLLNKSGLDVKEGQFAKHMQVSIVNDGPATFILNSKH